jgi:hypothetical protein
MNRIGPGDVDRPMRTRWVLVVAVLAGLFGGGVIPRLQWATAQADDGSGRKQAEALERIARSLEKIADHCR